MPPPLPQPPATERAIGKTKSSLNQLPFLLLINNITYKDVKIGSSMLLSVINETSLPFGKLLI